MSQTTPDLGQPPHPDDPQEVRRIHDARRQIIAQLGRVIVGQQAVIDQMLIAIFARGHGLLVGVPGLAKTLLVSSLARCLDLTFKRIQFTPDLMPSDITGTEMLHEDAATGARELRFDRGPVFAHILLADEINRTPPKTQAALLEAMQERQVSAGGVEHRLDEPFFVLATQNPIEQEGTYPLPEAQLDRFLFHIAVDYPQWEEEIEIMRRASGEAAGSIEPVVSRDKMLAWQSLVRRTPVADHVLWYAARLVRATRPDRTEAPDFVRSWVNFGAGPRASLNLIVASKARAVLAGRCHVAVEDVRAVAAPVLRHRVLPNYAAHAQNVSVEDIIVKLLQTIPADQALYEST